MLLLLTALLGCTPPTASATPSAAEELRGVWVTRWTWDDPEGVTRAINEIADAGFNAVFFQVRGTFDAYYDSPLEPRAERLGPTAWDPLETAVDAGHARGLQVHAWMNSFPLWRGTEPPAATEHAWNAHPAWRLADRSGQPMPLNEGYVFADPANPEVRARVAAVAADIAGRYAVDGVHLDYIRYPEDTTPPPDAAAHITATVAGVSQAVSVPVTAAVWGVYDNRWGWEKVLEGRDALYQDSAAFLAQGLVDATLPMVYFSIKEPGERLDFRTLAADHVSRAAGRHVYVGISAEHLSQEQVLACVDAAREAGANGVVLFDWSLGRAHFDALAAGPFKEPARPPAMPWRAAAP
ncbi:MAG: family 10 glycosylhydrolase [Alphaproteobacteria bacterium]|nr:family 10 glycosylhydrolase [Alphaproteobacteria bacterium]